MTGSLGSWNRLQPLQPLHTPTARFLHAREVDTTLTFRRSCREGICGSCAMNINGKRRGGLHSPWSLRGHFLKTMFHPSEKWPRKGGPERTLSVQHSWTVTSPVELDFCQGCCNPSPRRTVAGLDG